MRPNTSREFPWHMVWNHAFVWLFWFIYSCLSWVSGIKLLVLLPWGDNNPLSAQRLFSLCSPSKHQCCGVGCGWKTMPTILAIAHNWGLHVNVLNYMKTTLYLFVQSPKNNTIAPVLLYVFARSSYWNTMKMVNEVYFLYLYFHIFPWNIWIYLKLILPTTSLKVF